MPAEISLTSPTVAAEFHLDGDYEVTWTGGDTDTVWIFLGTSDPGSDYGSLVCQANNDGSFTLPGSEISQMPDGDAGLLLMQSTSQYQEVDGRWVAFAGSCRLTSMGSKP